MWYKVDMSACIYHAVVGLESHNSGVIGVIISYHILYPNLLRH